jgi:iron uptake system component EfeO/high-affinity iron transporter
LRTLSPLIARRDTSGVLGGSRRSLARVDAALRAMARPDGTLPRWDALPQRRRELIAGLVAGAVEELAYVPELIDPRPPRPLQRALGADPEPAGG